MNTEQEESKPERVNRLGAELRACRARLDRLQWERSALDTAVGLALERSLAVQRELYAMGAEL